MPKKLNRMMSLKKEFIVDSLNYNLDNFILYIKFNLIGFPGNSVRHVNTGKTAKRQTRSYEPDTWLAKMPIIQ